MSENISINKIITLIGGLLKKKETPLPPIPPQVLMLGSENRNGLSYRRLASNIISRQSEAGISNGKIFSKSENKSELLEIIRSEELIRELTINGKVEIAIPPGIKISGTIPGAPPIPFVATTTTITKGTGILR